MREQHNRLLRVIYNVGGEARLVMQDERDFIGPGLGNIARRDDGELIPWNAFTVTDCLDVSARHGTADGGSMEHPGHGDVVDVACTSGDFLDAFFSRNGAADQWLGHFSIRFYLALLPIRGRPAARPGA